MSNVQIRIQSDLSERLLEEIHRPGPRERVVFGLARHANAGDRRLVLIRDVVVPPESAFLPSHGHGARWKGSYMIELLNRALAENLGLFIFHAHGRSKSVQMSGDDRQSATQLLPKFQLVAPRRPHGSIVLGERAAAGMILMPDEDTVTENFTVRFLDDALETWPHPSASLEDLTLFDRQPLTDGAVIRRVLRDAIVAVVGLSGGGSQVVSQLATFGIGEIIGIDDQRVDYSNLFATSTFAWLDARLHIRKTTAMKLRTWLINRRVRFTPVCARIPEPRAVDELKRADLIIACVNNLHARADANELAWRFCIPYIDVGLILTVDERDVVRPKRLNAISGNVFTMLPGGPCLWCTGFVSQEKLDRETGGRGRPYLRSGSEDERAYVAAFNGTLASEAAAEILRLLVGIRRRSEAKRIYDGFSGTLLECAVKRSQTCDLCSSALAAGDPTWN
jgi:molybdopterin/thiamine biosynthesis adenylyltransferase